ncbi:metalloregulator ArsR/SmtB family transcription factor [Nonomuraea sp. NPDC048882]|uniref:ArsR/SmtB family transcription factor n=1 Tax=unclassified Nonomuraea TaxID=2593643 RepID=UPI000AF35E5F
MHQDEIAPNHHHDREDGYIGTGGAVEPLSRPQAEQLANALKAVADPTRLQLLSMISASESGEACVCDLTAPLGLTQPTVSHHLKILVDAGLLTREKRGKWAWYTIVAQRLQALGGLIPR